MIRLRTLTLLSALTIFSANATLAQHDRTIRFPDTDRYLTLVCDLHMHTVFSDGKVWPNIRVEEAQRDGLDAIAVTDHLEYQPHVRDIPHPDRNRAYDIARSVSAGNPIVISGSEVTRAMPIGHANAIFLTDTNRLLLDDPLEVFREAKRQGAFIFLNHPQWTAQRPSGIAALTDEHRILISEDALHGIEVVNDLTYSDEALQIALNHDLAILGTSDIHGLIDWQFDIPQGGHRPVTLVFAEERSEQAIKRALFDRRTVAWFDNTIIGREKEIVPLIYASISIANASYMRRSSVLEVILDNRSDVNFLLRNKTEFTFHDAADLVEIAPNTHTMLQVKTREHLDAISLTFEVLNAVTAPGVHADVTLTAPIIPTDQ